MKRAGFIITLALLGAALTATPASAAPVIMLSPGDGAMYQQGDTVNIRARIATDAVTFDPGCLVQVTVRNESTGAILNAYTWDQGAEYSFERSYTLGDNAVGLVSIAFALLSAPEECDGEWQPVSREIEVRAPDRTPFVTDLDVRPSPFYPYVRDGRKDTAKIIWTHTPEADVRIRIRNRFGNVVRSSAWFNDLHAGSWVWTWNGRKNNGRLVAPGRYVVQVIAVTVDGRDRASDIARVRRGTP